MGPYQIHCPLQVPDVIQCMLLLSRIFLRLPTLALRADNYISLCRVLVMWKRMGSSIDRIFCFSLKFFLNIQLSLISKYLNFNINTRIDLKWWYLTEDYNYFWWYSHDRYSNWHNLTSPHKKNLVISKFWIYLFSVQNIVTVSISNYCMGFEIQTPASSYRGLC